MPMEPIILDNIPFKPNLAHLHEHLHVPSRPAAHQVFDILAAEAAEVARPRALYGLAVIEEHGDDFIVVDKIHFKSRVLAVNVKPVHRVFPFVVTCGTEMVQWADGISGMLEQFYADGVKTGGAAHGRTLSRKGNQTSFRYRPDFPDGTRFPGGLAHRAAVTAV